MCTKARDERHRCLLEPEHTTTQPLAPPDLSFALNSFSFPEILIIVIEHLYSVKNLVSRESTVDSTDVDDIEHCTRAEQNLFEAW